jgi:hypothetical protein
MKLLRRTLVVLAGLLLTGSACRAQDFGFVWFEWERSAVERRGPERAEGLLLYFHGFGVQHAYLHPIPPIFTEMAKVAAWDVMRINRLPIADSEAQDDDILGLVASASPKHAGMDTRKLSSPDIRAEVGSLYWQRHCRTSMRRSAWRLEREATSKWRWSERATCWRRNWRAPGRSTLRLSSSRETQART